MDIKIYWFWLSLFSELGQKRLGELISVFGTAREVFYAKPKELLQCKSISRKIAEDMQDKKDLKCLNRQYDNLGKRNICFATYEDRDFPERLRHIDEAPYYLYYRGKLPEDDRPAIAVIGSRESSEYGKRMGFEFSRALAADGICIISGLADGVDSCAHRGALQCDGITYGVMGSGIDICYPERNIDIYHDIQKKGGVISEYAPGRSPLAFNFPMRNRLIAGLSDGILVIEARKRSGTLITVDRGLEQGKDIYAVPGRINDELSCGCNNLIKYGARLVTEPCEIEEELVHRFPDYFGNKKRTGTEWNKKNDNLLAREEKIVYAMLSLEPIHAERIIEESELKPEKLALVLYNLVEKGMIKEIDRNYYIRNQGN